MSLSTSEAVYSLEALRLVQPRGEQENLLINETKSVLVSSRHYIVSLHTKLSIVNDALVSDCKYLVETSFSDEVKTFTSPSDVELFVESIMMNEGEAVKVEFSLEYVPYSSLKSKAVFGLSTFHDEKCDSVSVLYINHEGQDKIAMHDVHRISGDGMSHLCGYIRKNMLETLKEVLGEEGNIKVIK